MNETEKAEEGRRMNFHIFITEHGEHQWIK